VGGIDPKLLIPCAGGEVINMGSCDGLTSAVEVAMYCRASYRKRREGWE
jgi:hypothetical protein